MLLRKVTVASPIGLHARPAAEFVRAVTECGLPVVIGRAGDDGADARSLLAVMSQDFECGCEVLLTLDPESPMTGDGEAVLDKLAALLSRQPA